MDDGLTGGCACGAIRYRVKAPPMIVHCCHCTTCQTESGSAFALNGAVETAAIALESGTPEAVMTPAESGEAQTVLRCPACRVALWSHYGGSGRAIAFVRVGTLDTPSAWPPDVHIYVRSKLDWVALPTGARAYEGYYPPKEVWSADAQRRWKATRAG